MDFHSTPNAWRYTVDLAGSSGGRLGATKSVTDRISLHELADQSKQISPAEAVIQEPTEARPRPGTTRLATTERLLFVRPESARISVLGYTRGDPARLEATKESFNMWNTVLSLRHKETVVRGMAEDHFYLLSQPAAGRSC